MPHQFRARPDHPAVPYLVRLHADLGGRIQANKIEAEHLAADMKAVEAVIKIFNPEYNCRAISARRKRPANPWFKRGGIIRAALDVLRTAPEPMTVRELARALLKAKGVAEPAAKQLRDLEGGLRAGLEHNAGRTVDRVGEGMPRRWRLMGNNG